MYFIGKDSSHLSELTDFWWKPMSLGLLALFFGGENNTKEIPVKAGFFYFILINADFKFLFEQVY